MKSVSDGRCLGQAISQLRPQSYVDLYSVPGAGHHVHADQPKVFCELVNTVCDVTDKGDDRQVSRVTGEPEKEPEEPESK